MGDLIPPRSLVEVDVKQTAVRMSGWKMSVRVRSTLVWHTNGHSCCWCDFQGKELTPAALPALPPARQTFERLPQEASVIGRVTNSWLPSDQHSRSRV